MNDVKLPPCGLYRTTEPIAEIPAGRLVYFHNHGEPGPGVYLPVSWTANRARFSDKGTLLPDPTDASALVPLEPEGFYRVVEPFFCCDQECRRFEEDALVQLGYDGSAHPILFTPEIADRGLAIPERGVRIDDDRLTRIALLQVRVADRPPDAVH